MLTAYINYFFPSVSYEQVIIMNNFSVINIRITCPVEWGQLFLVEILQFHFLELKFECLK